MKRFSSYPNRYLCTVLDEINKCYDTRNFSPVKGLVEEARILGERMESALEDNNDIEDGHEAIKEIKAEINELEKELKALKKEKKSVKKD